MYISNYWGHYIGGTDDSLTLVSYLANQEKDEISLREIFTDTGLDQQNGTFQQTTAPLQVSCSNGSEAGYSMEFYYAIDLITDIAALLLECKVSGFVDLRELDGGNVPARVIRITATPEEHALINQALAVFSADPLSCDLSEMVPEEDMREMAGFCEQLRRELYESPDLIG